MPASEKISSLEQQTFRLASTLDTLNETGRKFVNVYTFKQQNAAFLDDLSFAHPEVMGQGIPVDYLMTMYPEVLKYGRNVSALKVFFSNLDALFRNNFFDTARANRILENCYGVSGTNSMNLVNELFQAYKFVEAEKLLASRNWEKLVQEKMISDDTFTGLVAHPNSTALTKFLGNSTALISMHHVLNMMHTESKYYVRVHPKIFKNALALNTKTWAQLLGKTPSNRGERLLNLFGVKPQPEFFLN